jgi:hypothetical protein
MKERKEITRTLSPLKEKRENNIRNRASTTPVWGEDTIYLSTALVGRGGSVSRVILQIQAINPTFMC